jgi:mannose-6-phosphate isomerase-like protein (cupin superfamily)
VHVKVLEFIEYPENGEPWRSEKVRVEAWSDIESAIRRLDRNRFPFLFLWPTTDEAHHDLSEDEVFQVMGGRGAYWVAGNVDGSFERRLHFPEQGGEEVEVWESDQGYAAPARHVCFDVEAVLRAARYYAERGGFDPHFTWYEGV